MFEIRIHGRGGQGSVTAAELIAQAAFCQGKFSQAFPNFGVERRGAPVAAYARISDRFIRRRSQIYRPDFVIVQDSSLTAAGVFSGVKPETVVLINTKKPASRFSPPAGTVKTIPAAKIALEIIGRPIANTVLLGAFAELSGLIGFSAVKKAIKQTFIGEIAEKNIQATQQGFQFFSSRKSNK